MQSGRVEMDVSPTAQTVVGTAAACYHFGCRGCGCCPLARPVRVACRARCPGRCGWGAIGASERSGEGARCSRGVAREVDPHNWRQDKASHGGRTRPEAFGAHKALESIPYLYRDAEGQLVDVLGSGVPALVLGPSMAGKTRMAAQVVLDNYADRVLVVPDVPDGLPLTDK